MVKIGKYLNEDVIQAEFDLQYDKALSRKVNSIFNKVDGLIDNEEEEYGDIRATGYCDKKKANKVQKELKKIGVEEYDYS